MSGKNCDSCQAPDAGSRCGFCKSVWYCNRDCQREGWKEHKPVCPGKTGAAAPAPKAEESYPPVQLPLSLENDPVLKKLFENPRVKSCVAKIMSRPDEYKKYESDSEIMSAFSRVQVIMAKEQEARDSQNERGEIERLKAERRQKRKAEGDAPTTSGVVEDPEVAIGIDFGSQTCTVSSWIQGTGLPELVNNEEGEPHTPNAIGFMGQERLVGVEAQARIKSNFKNTICNVKQLFELLDEGEVVVNYCGDSITVSPHQLGAMLFKNLLSHVGAKNKPAASLALSVPSNFSEKSRAAVFDAMRVVGDLPTCVITDAVAVSLCYALKNMNAGDTKTRVMFVDVGHSYTAVTVSDISPDCVNVLASVVDSSVSSSRLDSLLFDQFAAELKQKKKIDVLENAKAKYRLGQAMVSLKHALSSNEKADYVCESLMDDVDAKGATTRADFTTLTAAVSERIGGLVSEAAATSGGMEGIQTVVLLGGGSRTQSVTAVVESVTGKTVDKAMDSSSSAALGCAIFAANSSEHTFAPRVNVLVNNSPFVSTTQGNLTDAQLAELKQIEEKMAAQDKENALAAEKRNAFESFMYSARDQCGGDANKNTLLDEAEEWFYDDGETASAADVEARLVALKAAF